MDIKMKTDASYHIFVLVRYSVLATVRNREWAITRRARNRNSGTRDAGDLYEKELLSDRRLAQHEKMFRTITLPGLRSTPQDTVSIGVFTSDRLPEHWLDRLRATIADVPNADIIKLPPVNDFDDYAKTWVRSKLYASPHTAIAYATVRLDDDDALAEDFVSTLAPYVNKCLAGYFASFPLGYRGAWDGSRFTQLTETYLPKTSQGLAHISWFDAESASGASAGTVYSRASHRTLDRHYPVILDSRKRVYIRTVHDAQDTVAGGFAQSLWRRLQRYAENPADLAEVSARFQLDPSILPEAGSPGGRRIPRLQRMCQLLWNPGR